MSYLTSEPHLYRFTLPKEYDGISRNYNRKNLFLRFGYANFLIGQLSCVWQWAKCLPASRLQILPRLVPTPGFPAFSSGSVTFSRASASQVTASNTRCMFSTRLIIGSLQ